MGADRKRQTGPSTPDDWRAILLRHAEAVHGSALAGTKDQPTLSDEDAQTLGDAIGNKAEAALRIVEDYAIGAAARDQAASADTESEGGTAASHFSARLALVLDGFEPRPRPQERQDRPPRPQVIQSELWQLLRMVRESAELSYAREIDLVELDRRILLLINQDGPQVPADIAGATGVDKAQVSRSVKRLLELRMIEREQIRAPVRLTRKGQTVSDRLRKLANLRNRELVFGIGDDELKQFFAVIEKLLGRAIILYEQEKQRMLGAAVEGDGPVAYARPPEERAPEDSIVVNRERIMSPLMTLSAYFSRSGSLVFKRLTHLSSFEAWVLNEIGMTPPIAWGDLVERINRDHSQAGRTVTSLIKRGLVEREGKAGRRHGRFSPTDKGLELYDLIQQASRERSAFLMAPLSPAERDAFLTVFGKIRLNAVNQLERERAYGELDES